MSSSPPIDAESADSTAPHQQPPPPRRSRQVASTHTVTHVPPASELYGVPLTFHHEDGTDALAVSISALQSQGDEEQKTPCSEKACLSNPPMQHGNTLSSPSQVSQPDVPPVDSRGEAACAGAAVTPCGAQRENAYETADTLHHNSDQPSHADASYQQNTKAHRIQDDTCASLTTENPTLCSSPLAESQKHQEHEKQTPSAYFETPSNRAALNSAYSPHIASNGSDGQVAAQHDIGAVPSVLTRWSTGLLGVTQDIPSTIDSLLCPYCISSTHFNYVYREQHGMFPPFILTLCCFDTCWSQQLWPVMTPFSSLALHTLLIRREMRKRYGLTGNLLLVPPPRDDHNANVIGATTFPETVNPHCSGHAMNSTGEGNERTSAATPSPPLRPSHDTAAARGSSSGVRPSDPLHRTFEPQTENGDYWMTFLMDVVASCLCVPCAIAQHHREMTLHGDWPGSAILSQSDFTKRDEEPGGGQPERRQPVRIARAPTANSRTSEASGAVTQATMM